MHFDNLTQLLGFAGALIAGYAYLPQITHLVHEHCSAGISRKAFSLWLLSTTLMQIHAVAIWDPVFLMLGGVQLGAIGIILYYANSYKNLVCPTHFSEAAKLEGKRVATSAVIGK